MGWGEPYEPDLVAVVRTYVNRPTTGNFEKLKAALEKHDKEKVWRD